MAYKYVAYTSGGEITRGVLDVETEQAAEEALWRSDLTILDLKRQGQGLRLGVALPAFQTVKKREVIVLGRQLATLLASGIPVLAALQMLKDLSGGSLLGKVLGQAVEQILQGHSFSQALASHPEVFPPLFIRLTEVGEQTGNLEGELRRLADHMEKEESVRRKIRSALVYPAVTGVLAVFLTLLSVIFVLPGTNALLTDLKVEAPLPTRILLDGANFIGSNFLLIIFLLAALVAGGTWYSRTAEGRRRMDYALMTRVPVVKALMCQWSMASLSRTLAMLLAAGLPLAEAMDLLLRTARNRAVLDALERARSGVLGGSSLSVALGQLDFFPPMLAQMVRLGEDTGALAGNLETAARVYEDQTDRAMASVTSLIEPLLIIAIGGFIAFLAISIIAPIYSILRVIR